MTRTVHVGLAVWALAGLVSFGWGGATVKAQSENVLIIVADDLGVDILESYGEGSTYPPTPTLDMLRDTGVLFRNAWTYPVCSPTRATIQTGRYGFRTGIGDVVAEEDPAGLPFSETIIPEVLDLNPELGYAHAAIGKWHLSSEPQAGSLGPNLSGYSHYSGFLFGQFFPLPLTYFNWPKTENGVTANTQVYATTDNVNEAIEWINDQGEGPWFMWLAFNAPHSPFHAPPEELHTYDLSGDPSKRLQYEAMVEAMDTEIGRLFDSIPAETLENTNIIFLGDNGTPSDTTEPPFDPDRAKGTLYEGGVNAPLIISGPQVAVPGSESDVLVDSTDLFATALEMMGVDLEASLPGSVLDSVSLLPLLKGEAFEPRLFVFAERFNNTVPGQGLGQTIRNDTFKLIRYMTQPEEFYDLNADPFENTDLLLGELDPLQQANYDELTLTLDDLLASHCEGNEGIHNLTQVTDYASIQCALEAAVDGDQIEVDAGLYMENIDFLDKDITLSGTDPLDPNVVAATVIDGGGLATVVTLSAGQISGFTITGGGNTGPAAGGVHATGTAVVSHNVITGNSADQKGGGVTAEDTVVVHNNRIVSNFGGNRAGGVNARDDALVIDNYIAFNEANSGGGVRARNNCTIRNNTIVFNASIDMGGGLLGGGGILAEHSSILLSNVIAFSPSGVGIHVPVGDSVTSDYNCVFGNFDGEYGGAAAAGSNDLNVDPELEDDELHLLSSSPCINAGDPNLAPLDNETDIDGQERILDKRIDIGSDERAICQGDANGDGTVDPLDSGYILARFGCLVDTGIPDCDAADVNGDGEVNPLDSGFVLARFGDCP